MKMNPGLLTGIIKGKGIYSLLRENILDNVTPRPLEELSDSAEGPGIHAAQRHAQLISDEAATTTIHETNQPSTANSME